jgi:thioredoxin reductase (NADPH)
MPARFLSLDLNVSASGLAPLLTATIDCAIIGGGPAGLTAATYLGRFRMTTAVFDDGRSRVLQIPRSRNVPGFPEGIEGAGLH